MTQAATPILAPVPEARPLWPRLAIGSLAALVLLPLAVIFASFADPQGAVWAHFGEFVLPRLVVNTLWLLIGVGFGTAVLGISLAWLTAVCEFPGRRWLSWGLLLPLAVPGYVLGFVMIGLLDFTGPLQTAWRAQFGAAPQIPIRSRGGVIAVMALTLYPYVYLVARNAFQTQGRRALEAAQTLGLGRVGGFFRVALPMARPWIAGGLALVLMETLADFGTVAVFNYDTFTTAIYRAWFGLYNLSAASQLASLLVVLVFIALALEQRSRRGQRFTAGGRADRGQRIALGPVARWLAALWCGLVFAVAVAVPLAQLLAWAWQSRGDLDVRYLGFLYRSLILAASGAGLVVLLGLTLAYALRARPGRGASFIGRLSTLGYALPGTVLAVGFYLPMSAIDNGWIALGTYLDQQWTPLLGGTLVAMLLAYAVRFLAVGFHPVEAALHRITPSMDEAARNLGSGGRDLLARVHLPLLRGGIATASVLVFVDIMKEMPITLMTRPFGWDTLAIRVFEMTSEGEWQRAALPAVTLVIAGLIPVLLLMRGGDTEQIHAT
ncbi:MAG TPA: iron ABC transporter permease [Porticoccaceae bacterium]|nr:iron ABC transporter permease [Porticoccaceae bacterium]